MDSIGRIIETTAPTSPVATTERDPRVEAHNWQFDTYHPALAQVLPQVKQFCSDVLRGEPPRWLSLLGPSGIGKTFILRQAFQFLRDNWKLEVKTRYPDGSVSGRTRQHYHVIPSLDLDTYLAPRQFAEDFDLIYVEDVGVAVGDKGSGAVLRDRVIELLQHRTRRWTLIDANLYRREIEEQLDGRIASRLRRDGSVCIELPGSIPDYNDQ